MCAKIILNRTINLFLKTAISVLLISNHNGFRVLFDKIASVYFILKDIVICQRWKRPPREPALCQLYRHSVVLGCNWSLHKPAPPSARLSYHQLMALVGQLLLLLLLLLVVLVAAAICRRVTS